MAQYRSEKSSQYQEFRRLGYNRRDLRVNKEVLIDLMEAFTELPAYDDDRSITDAVDSLRHVIDLAIQTDMRPLAPAQKRLWRDVIQMTQNAFAGVMQSVLCIPLGRAVSTAQDSSGALLNSPGDLDEVRRSLQDARKQVVKAVADAKKCLARADRDPHLAALANVLRVFVACVGELDRRELRPFKDDLSTKASRLAGEASRACAAIKGGANGIARRFPRSKAHWTTLTSRVGPWTVNTASAAQDHVQTVFALQSIQLNGRFRTCQQHVSRALLPRLPDDYRRDDIRHDESLKLLIEPLYILVAACGEIGHCFLTTEAGNHDEVARLQSQKAATLTHIECAQRNLPAAYDARVDPGLPRDHRTGIFPGHAHQSGPFLRHMDRALGTFWEAAAKLDRIAEIKYGTAETDTASVVSSERVQRQLIETVALLSEARRRLQDVALRFTGATLDLQSVDWRIARDMGRFFCDLRQAHSCRSPLESQVRFDDAVERTIDRIATEFGKARSPEGTQMGVRAKWAYREAVAGLLQRERSWQEVIQGQASVGEYLVKRGQTSLAGRLAFAGVNGKMPSLFQAPPRNLLVPNFAVAKLLFSPMSFWSDYRKLSRSVLPGEAFPWSAYGTMAWRNGFKQVFRMLNFLMPRLGRTSLSVVLAAWAVHREGVVALARKSMAAGCVDVPLAAGQGGAVHLAGGVVKRRLRRDAASDLSVTHRTPDDGQLRDYNRWDIDCSIGGRHWNSAPASAPAGEPSEVRRYLDSPDFAPSEADQRRVLSDADVHYIKKFGAPTLYLVGVLDAFIDKRLDLLAKMERLPEGSGVDDFCKQLMSEVAQANRVRQALSGEASIGQVRDQFNSLSGQKIALVDLLRARILHGELHPRDLAEYSDEIIPAPRSDHFYDVCKTLLNKLIKDTGVESVHAEDVYEIRFKFLNGDGVLEDDQSAHLPKKASLLDIALGDFYVEHWNGHIVVEGLPPELEPLFRKNSYYGAVFPISAKLHDSFREEYSRLQSPDVRKERLPVWEGLIKRRLAEWADAEKSPSMRSALEKALAGEHPLYTLQYTGNQEIKVNNYIVFKHDDYMYLINLTTGRGYKAEERNFYDPKLSVQNMWRKVIMENVGSRDKLELQIGNRENFFSGEALVRMPAPALYRPGIKEVRMGGLKLVPVPSIEALADRMDRTDQEVFNQNFDFRFTSRSDVRIHAQLQAAKLALEHFSLTLSLPTGGGWLVKALSLGLTTTHVGLSLALRDRQKTLEAREDMLKEIETNLLFTALTELPDFTKAVQRLKATAAKIAAQ